MFFGGIRGFDVFFPSEIAVRTEPAPVVLTELLLANRPVPAGRSADGRTLLPTFVTYAEEVVLSHEDDVVSLEFAALHFAAPQKLRYAFRLDGFDRDWIPTGADRRVATYTGLAPGRYLFRVKAANPDGVWGEREARLGIVVTPPIWGTWWFRLAAALGLAAAVVAALRRRMRTVRLAAAMRAAHDAQMAVMPHEDPEVEGFEVSGICIPALDVGGDFFDYVTSGEAGGKLGIVVGDVSGKGTPAAMAAAMSGGMVGALVRRGEPLEDVAEQANGALRAKIGKRMFAAACLATLDPERRELTFVNAGSASRSSARATRRPTSPPRGARSRSGPARAAVTAHGRLPSRRATSWSSTPTASPRRRAARGRRGATTRSPASCGACPRARGRRARFATRSSGRSRASRGARDPRTTSPSSSSGRSETRTGHAPYHSARWRPPLPRPWPRAASWSGASPSSSSPRTPSSGASSSTP
jgi:Serine phosphatase RsbU, regulator of sigma subunit